MLTKTQQRSTSSTTNMSKCATVHVGTHTNAVDSLHAVCMTLDTLFSSVVDWWCLKLNMRTSDTLTRKPTQAKGSISSESIFDVV